MRTRHWPRRTSNCIKTRLYAFAYLRDTKYWIHRSWFPREGWATRFITVLFNRPQNRFPSVSNRRATSNLSLRIPRIFVFLTARRIINFCPWSYHDRVCDVKYYCPLSLYEGIMVSGMSYNLSNIAINNKMREIEMRLNSMIDFLIFLFFVYTFFLFYYFINVIREGFLACKFQNVERCFDFLKLSIIHFEEKNNIIYILDLKYKYLIR